MNFGRVVFYTPLGNKGFSLTNVAVAITGFTVGAGIGVVVENELKKKKDRKRKK